MKWTISLAIAIALLAGCNDESQQGDDAGPDSGAACTWDDNNDPTLASALTLGAPVEDYICPQGDQDWYTLTVPTDSNLVRVDLSFGDTPITPLNLTYGIWDGAAEESLLAPQSSESASASEPLDIVHSMDPGEYKLVVRDRGDDAEDVWHPYLLTVTHLEDPDQNESNDNQEQATDFGSGPTQGYIAYRGDQDWFRVDAEANNLLHVRLTMPASGIEPSFSVLNAESETLSFGVNEAGKFEPTDLTYVQALDAAGAYYVVVHDDDDLDFDLENPYEIELGLSPDPDSNEDNDHPDQATPLGSLQCSLYNNTWSEWIENTGYIASSGDIDWFGLELLNCARSVIEVEVMFDSPGTLPDDLQASARLVRQVDTYECAVDSECLELPLACDYDLDCSRSGNTCLTSGVCGGAGVCLGETACGVDFIFGSAPEGSPGSVRLSAPLFWNGMPFYVAVADHQGDSYSADHNYTMRVRVRRDPDLFEPSEAMTAGPPESDDPVVEHIAFAEEVVVHDCTADDCCDSTTWVEAYLSYAYDQDWYAYQHPCPGQDCMVRVNYEFDSGPVDFYLQVYRGDNSWFDNLADTTDPGDQSAKSGYFGGLGTEDYCFYAYQGHVGDPFYYYLPIRDTVYVSEDQEDGGTWDWSSEQGYRFCIEKIANACLEPCFLYEDGCGAP